MNFFSKNTDYYYIITDEEFDFFFPNDIEDLALEVKKRDYRFFTDFNIASQYKDLPAFSAGFFYDYESFLFENKNIKVEFFTIIFLRHGKYEHYNLDFENQVNIIYNDEFLKVYDNQLHTFDFSDYFKKQYKLPQQTVTQICGWLEKCYFENKNKVLKVFNEIAIKEARSDYGRFNKN